MYHTFPEKSSTPEDFSRGLFVFLFSLPVGIGAVSDQVCDATTEGVTEFFKQMTVAVHHFVLIILVNYVKAVSERLDCSV